jgi:signal transduction histidine kinase/CheY-like chemotaxis protein
LKKLIQFFTFIRTNGCHHLEEGRSVRQVVYTNMIWLVAFIICILHSVATAILLESGTAIFICGALITYALYLLSFFLIRFNYAGAGKHMMVIATFISIAYLDHFVDKTIPAFLYLFAFIPTPMNIFTWAKHKATIIIYVGFTLFYTIFTRFIHYPYPHLGEMTGTDISILALLNIVLGFLLFVVYTTYIILNNFAKQKNLLVRSLSLQVTLDNAGAAIWSIDNNFCLTTINAKYLDSIQKEFGVSGLKPGVNIRNHALWKMLPDEFKEQYKTVLSGREIVQEAELNHRIYEIKGVPVYDLKGVIRGATFGSTDITQRKKEEEALIKAKKAAEEASNAKARFLSNMSHELRTPLNGIIGITRIMQDEQNLPSQLPNLKTMQDLSEHTLQIINNILDLTKIEAGKATLDRKRFNLKRFIDKTYSIFAGTSQLKAIRLTIETSGPVDVFVEGDEVRLNQVLINLLGNAFKFTERGNIVFKVVVKENHGSDHYSVRFHVVDTGIGIKKENLGKIFESFSQADSNTTRRFGGTGLGLSIADKILNIMHSKLMVESEYGKGSNFWFDLSLRKSSYSPPSKMIFTESVLDLSHIKILLAEDNAVNQVVASRILQKWKANVFIACHGQEAVLLTQMHEFNVILMDLDMPVMDGYEATGIIKELFPAMPVIALTAASFDDMDNFLSNKGFDEVVQKPFVPEDLYNKITSVL